MKKLIMFMTVLLCATTMQADFFAPRNADKLNDILDDYDLAVVLFNPFDSDESVERYGDIEQMKSDFIKLSNQDRYQRARVAFVTINTAHDESLAKEFNLDRENVPAILIFKNGEVFKKDGNIVKRSGFLSGQSMKDFIETYLGKLINDVSPQIQQKIRYVERPRRVVRRYVSSPRYYYDDYDYYSYPYYGGWYGRSYYRPGFGVGVGFGGRRGGIGFGFGW